MCTEKIYWFNWCICALRGSDEAPKFFAGVKQCDVKYPNIQNLESVHGEFGYEMKNEAENG